MPFGAAQIPPEVWVYVFKLLPKADKLNVRSCCKYFKRLVDHWSLWRNESVVLNKLCAYSSQFWTILRRRRTTTVVVRSASSKDWEQLARWLPTLTTIVIEDGFVKEVFAILNRFPDLRKLSVRRCRFPQAYNLAPIPQQLTHFSVCEVFVQTSEILNVVARLTNLTSLSYHTGRFPFPKDTFHDMLAHLPNLKHLSLRMGRMFGTLPDEYFCPEKRRGTPGQGDRPSVGPVLTNLEILDYTDPILSQNAFVGLASLRSLSVFYRGNEGESHRDSRCHLTTWLTSLSELTALSVIKGPAVEKYVSSIPDSLTSLTLRVKMEPEDLQTLATRVPGLLHLHMDMISYSSEINIRAISQLFPKLKTLKIRHQGVPESDLVNLQYLQHLERLEILDCSSQPSPPLLNMVQRLQNQTKHRIQVVYCPSQRDVLNCECTHL